MRERVSSLSAERFSRFVDGRVDRQDLVKPHEADDSLLPACRRIVAMRSLSMVAAGWFEY